MNLSALNRTITCSHYLKAFAATLFKVSRLIYAITRIITTRHIQIKADYVVRFVQTNSRRV